MQKNTIINTDIAVSLLGLGTVKIGRNTGVKYPTTFEIPDDQRVIEILNSAADCGINLLDTAPAYGNSEERLGELLKHTNNEWIICTKVGEIFNPKTGTSSYDFTAEFIEHSIMSSLKKLRREYLDIVLIHSDGNDNAVIKMGALEVLKQLKDKGLIRASGMSTKTVEGGIIAAQQSDIVMLTHNLVHQEEQPVIDYAYKHDTGVFIKKALSSGHVATTKTIGLEEDKVRKTFDHIYKNQGISSIILGSINPRHIRDNAQKAQAAYQAATHSDSPSCVSSKNVPSQ